MKIIGDRDDFIDELIELFRKIDNTPMNGDFVNTLAKLPDEILLKLHSDYTKKQNGLYGRENTKFIDIARPQPN